jgi:site-specific DNA-methyltransferase (adenine-specific)
MPKLNITNEDCMELMQRYDDNHFELAIVDPPYGIGMAKQIDLGNSNYIKKHIKKDWDNETPKAEYFSELKRVSKNMIIWGGNYFINHLSNTRCFIVWNKENGGNNMADCELAWTSFNTSVRMYTGHIFKGIGNTNYISYHPTQKPVALYKWLLQNYAKPGDKILDTHLGSGSIAIACHYMGFDLTCCELDTDYYNSAVERIEKETKQLEFDLL